MKKIISLALGLILVLGCTILPVSAATPSPEIKDVIISVGAVQSDGTKIDIKLEKSEKADADFKPETKEEKIITQVDVKVEKDAKYPLTLTIKVDGVKKSSKMYALAKDETGAIKKIEVTISADGVVNLDLDKYYSSLAFVADIETATQVGTSDKTGNATIPAVACVLAISAAAVVVSKKKLEEN